MKQSTLKRPTPSTVSVARKKQQTVAGTASAPIELEQEGPIDLDAIEDSEDDTEEPVAGPSKLSTAAPSSGATTWDPLQPKLTSKPTPPSSGPSTSNPLAINDPDFDVRSCFTNVKPQVILKDPDLDLLYFKRMIQGKQLFEYLLNELPWYRVTYITRGMTIRTPRWTCVWGCDETGASLTSYKIKPRPIPTALQTLLRHMQETTEAKYNFVLVNYYENGRDSISFHSDDEAFLGKNPCIASLSLGSQRDFLMKHKTDKSAKLEKWNLESGDCVVMRGTTQSKWLHSIPKRANAAGRMNLTFRRAMTTGGTNNYYRYNVFDGPVHRWTDGKMVEAR